MRLAQLEAVVESLLFISGEAVPLTAIAQTIEMDKATARAIVKSLADKYEAEQRGIRCGNQWRLPDVYGGGMLHLYPKHV